MIFKRLLALWNHVAQLGTLGQTPSFGKRISLTNHVALTLGLIACFFVIPHALSGNWEMVGINLFMVVAHFSVPWFNLKGFYNFTRLSTIFIISTGIFIVVGMTGTQSAMHTCLVPIAGFAALLFGPDEKKGLVIGVGYPVVLFAILHFNDYVIFPNYIGNNLGLTAGFNYFMNFVMIILSIRYLYRATETAENKYKNLYEEHVKAQKLLDEERVRAMYTMKMAALGEMAGGIAHEINSPLSIITLQTELLKKGLERKSVTEDKVLAGIDKINSTAHRIGDIISAMRSISRSSVGLPIKEVDFKIVLEEILLLCRERFTHKGIKLSVEVPDQLPHVLCRSVEIGQVLLNLLNNAYDAIEARENPKVLIQVVDLGEWVKVSVSDNGHGIKEDLREKIFNPFFTTKDVGKGTGLGLSISKGIMEANGGHLYLDTKVTEGTSFVLELEVAGKK